MAARDAEFSERDLSGFKYLDRLLPMFERLHDVGCARDRAGNRTLHYDQYCLLVLLTMFNPDRAFAARHSAGQHAAQGPEAARLSAHLAGLAVRGRSTSSIPSAGRASSANCSRRCRGRGRSPATHVPQVLTAVDGSVVRTLAGLAEAAYLTDKNGRHALRLAVPHALRDRPRRAGADGRDHARSTAARPTRRTSCAAGSKPDRCYVMDRWYAEFALWNDIVRAKSSYVCRIRDNSNLSDVVEERPLSDAARQAGVIGDAVVRLGSQGPASRPSGARGAGADDAAHRRPAAARAAPPGRRPTASCASPPTCSTCRPR